MRKRARGDDRPDAQPPPAKRVGQEIDWNDLNLAIPPAPAHIQQIAAAAPGIPHHPVIRRFDAQRQDRRNSEQRDPTAGGDSQGRGDPDTQPGV